MGCGSSYPNIPYDERTRDMFDSGVDPNSKNKRKKQQNLIRRPFKNNNNNLNMDRSIDFDNSEIQNNNYRSNPRSNGSSNNGSVRRSKRAPNDSQSYKPKKINKKTSANSSIISNKDMTMLLNKGGIIDENITKNPGNLPFTFYCTQNIPAHNQPVTCLIQLSNQNMASCSLDQYIKIWEKSDNGNFELGTTLVGHKAGVLAIKEAISLSILCSCGIDKTIKLWDLVTKECVGTLVGHSQCVVSVEVSNSLGLVFSGADDTTIKIWSLEDYSLERTIEEHKKSVAALAYIETYSYLVSGSDDMTIKFYSSKSQFQCIKSITTIKSEIDCLKYAKNRIMASCEDGNVFFINVKILKRIRSVQFSPHAVHDFFVMDHEKYLVTGSSDAKGRVWRIGSGERSLLVGHNKEINGIILLKDGRIASGSADKTIRIWEANEYHPEGDDDDNEEEEE